MIRVKEGKKVDSLEISNISGDIAFGISDSLKLFNKPHLTTSNETLSEQTVLLAGALQCSRYSELSIAPNTTTVKFPWHALLKNNKTKHLFFSSNVELPVLVYPKLTILIICNVRLTASHEQLLHVEREIQAIQELGQTHSRNLEVQLLWYPTKKEIEKEIKHHRPLTIHYIGHSKYEVNQDKVIVELKLNNDVETVAIDELIDMASSNTKLYFFSSCQAFFPTNNYQNNIIKNAYDKKVAVIGYCFPFPDSSADVSAVFYQSFVSHGLVQAFSLLQLKLAELANENPVALAWLQEDLKITNSSSKNIAALVVTSVFRGRHKALNHLSEIATSEQVCLNLHAPEGTGKTALVQQFACLNQYELQSESFANGIRHRLSKSDVSFEVVESRQQLGESELTLLSRHNVPEICYFNLPELDENEQALFSNIRTTSYADQDDTLQSLPPGRRITNPAFLLADSAQRKAIIKNYEAIGNDHPFTEKEILALHLLIASPLALSPADIIKLCSLFIIPPATAATIENLCGSGVICRTFELYQVYSFAQFYFCKHLYKQLSEKQKRDNLNKLRWLYHEKIKAAERDRKNELCLALFQKEQQLIKPIDDEQGQISLFSRIAIIKANMAEYTAEQVFTQLEQAISNVHTWCSDEPEFALFALAKTKGIVAVQLKLFEVGKKYLYTALELLPKVNLTNRIAGKTRVAMLYRSLADAEIDPTLKQKYSLLAIDYFEQDNNTVEAERLKRNLQVIFKGPGVTNPWILNKPSQN